MDWDGIRVTYSDVLELVLSGAMPGEDALAPQCQLVASSVHGRPSGEGAPRGHHAGCLWRSHALLVAGTPERVVVHKLLPTAAYRPTLNAHFNVSEGVFCVRWQQQATEMK